MFVIVCVLLLLLLDFKLASVVKDKLFQRKAIQLRDAVTVKENFGIGSATKREALEMGKAWLGIGYTVSSKNSKVWISEDGLRQFIMAYKQGHGKIQANFQRRLVPKGTFNNYNDHLYIIK